jgi:holliday junction DNA helicase RuvA
VIAYIEGKIVHKSPTFFIIDNGNIGFQIHISLNTYQAIQHMESCRLFTYLNIKKDGQTIGGFELFGFFEESERIMFELLISVSGIGANTARVMLSSMTTNEIAGAIMIDNEKAISSIKGIGPKTAKRVILELKDKVAKTNTAGEITFTPNNTAKDEALIALTLLGFNKNTATNALNSVVKSYPGASVEEYIKHALKIL